MCIGRASIQSGRSRGAQSRADERRRRRGEGGEGGVEARAAFQWTCLLQIARRRRRRPAAALTAALPPPSRPFPCCLFVDPSSNAAGSRARCRPFRRTLLRTRLRSLAVTVGFLPGQPRPSRPATLVCGGDGAAVYLALGRRTWRKHCRRCAAARPTRPPQGRCRLRTSAKQHTCPIAASPPRRRAASALERARRRPRRVE